MEQSPLSPTNTGIESATLTPVVTRPQPSRSLAAERETIIVLDFGSQYSRLITRRVRECQVYCELLPPNTTWEQVRHLQVKGFILSGGPNSVYEEGAPRCAQDILESGLPVLGICYGMQLLAHQLGGKVEPGTKREYGPAEVELTPASEGAGHAIFSGLTSPLAVWMSHGDTLAELPPGFQSLARTGNSPFAAMGNSRGLIGLQFHPEVAHTPRANRSSKTSSIPSASVPLVGRLLPLLRKRLGGFGRRWGRAR